LNQYEAMIVFDPTFGANFDGCESEVRRLVERAEGEVVFLHRWDERRLAYKIKGRKRGVYVLFYFNAEPNRIARLERDAQLSEHVLRTLVIRADGVTREMMEKATIARTVESEEDDDSSDFSRRPRRGRRGTETSTVAGGRENDGASDQEALTGASAKGDSTELP